MILITRVECHSSAARLWSGHCGLTRRVEDIGDLNPYGKISSYNYMVR